METNRTYQRIEDLLHPLTGNIILRDAVWQVYETANLLGTAQPQTDMATPPTIIDSRQCRLAAPNHITTIRPDGSKDHTIHYGQYTFHSPKYGIGTFLVLPILPITTRLALDEQGNLRLTKSYKEPTLHVTATAPTGYVWVYTAFHTSTSVPRLELYTLTQLDGHQILSCPYPAYLPNCGNDGTTCLGDTRDKVSSFRGLSLPDNIVSDILLAQFNNDLFPNNSSIHTWIFPSKGAANPTHILHKSFSSHQINPIWPSIIL
jgi:hypothetical protein